MKRIIHLENDRDTEKFSDYVTFILYQNNKNITQSDCENLAVIMLSQLKIEKPEWWNNNYE